MIANKNRPVALRVQADKIPAALRTIHQWVVWHYTENRDLETGEIDWDKPPLNARGGAGSSTNSRTWSPFEIALSAYQKGGLDGVGFVLSTQKGEVGAVLVAVDLDHFRDKVAGAIEPWAKKIIEQLDSYTEISPSGEGIRIFLRGKLPPYGRKRENFECYNSDHSCRAAAARFLAWRTAQGLAPCSADPSAYNKARHRLPEGVLTRLTRLTGRQAQDRAPAPWRWNGRTLKVVDGSTVSMPDSPANHKAFPQARTQKAGVGFPIARLVVLFSLAVGTVLDAALGRYQGKHTGETALWHSLQDNLEPGDLLLADRYYGSFWELALTRQRDADMVCRLHQRRRADFRTGRRLGREDHVVSWSKPPRPEWLDDATYAALPATLAVREVRVRVAAAGFRTKVLVVATTLVDAAAFGREDVAVLYRMRWYAELDPRALKQIMQMDILR